MRLLESGVAWCRFACAVLKCAMDKNAAGLAKTRAGPQKEVYLFLMQYALQKQYNSVFYKPACLFVCFCQPRNAEAQAKAAAMGAVDSVVRQDRELLENLCLVCPDGFGQFVVEFARQCLVNKPP